MRIRGGRICILIAGVFPLLAEDDICSWLNRVVEEQTNNNSTFDGDDDIDDNVWNLLTEQQRKKIIEHKLLKQSINQGQGNEDDEMFVESEQIHERQRTGRRRHHSKRESLLQHFPDQEVDFDLQQLHRLRDDYCDVNEVSSTECHIGSTSRGKNLSLLQFDNNRFWRRDDLLNEFCPVEEAFDSNFYCVINASHQQHQQWQHHQQHQQQHQDQEKQKQKHKEEEEEQLRLTPIGHDEDLERKGRTETFLSQEDDPLRDSKSTSIFHEHSVNEEEQQHQKQERQEQIPPMADSEDENLDGKNSKNYMTRTENRSEKIERADNNSNERIEEPASSSHESGEDFNQETESLQHNVTTTSVTATTPTIMEEKGVEEDADIPIGAPTTTTTTAAPRKAVSSNGPLESPVEEESQIKPQIQEKDSSTYDDQPSTTNQEETEHIASKKDQASVTETRLVVDYASKSAGALILEKSSSLKGASNLLNSDKDKYAISPCEDDKYVALSLSEEILVKQVKVANYERYSSSPKEFQLLGSQTIDGGWVYLGTYTASPSAGIQVFDLKEPSWARYLQFRFLTHYGDEHYCTVSQIMVHGNTMLQGFHEQWKESEEETQKILEQVESGSSSNNDDDASAVDAVDADDVDGASVEADVGDNNNKTTVSYNGEVLKKENDNNDNQTKIQSQEKTEGSNNDSHDQEKRTTPVSSEDTSLDSERSIDKYTQSEESTMDKTVAESTSVPPVTLPVQSSSRNSVGGNSGKTEAFYHRTSAFFENSNMQTGLQTPRSDDDFESVLASASICLSSNVSTKSNKKKSIHHQMLNGLDKTTSAVTLSSRAKSTEIKGRSIHSNKEEGDLDAVIDTANTQIKSSMFPSLAEKLNSFFDATGRFNDNARAMTDLDVVKQIQLLLNNATIINSTSFTNLTDRILAAFLQSNSTGTVLSNGETAGVSESNNAQGQDEKQSSKGESMLSFDSLHDSDVLLAKFLEKLPSVECLKGLDYTEFKAKIISAKKGAGLSTSAGGAAQPLQPSSMEPIFKKLTDEIKSLQISLSVHDQFTKAAVSCYQQVLFDLIVELETVKISHEARIQKLENELRDVIVPSSKWLLMANELFGHLFFWGGEILSLIFSSILSSVSASYLMFMQLLTQQEQNPAEWWENNRLLLTDFLRSFIGGDNSNNANYHNITLAKAILAVIMAIWSLFFIYHTAMIPTTKIFVYFLRRLTRKNRSMPRSRSRSLISLSDGADGKKMNNSKKLDLQLQKQQLASDISDTRTDDKNDTEYAVNKTDDNLVASKTLECHSDTNPNRSPAQKRIAKDPPAPLELSSGTINSECDSCLDDYSSENSELPTKKDPPGIVFGVFAAVKEKQFPQTQPGLSLIRGRDDDEEEIKKQNLIHGKEDDKEEIKQQTGSMTHQDLLNQPCVSQRRSSDEVKAAADVVASRTNCEKQQMVISTIVSEPEGTVVMDDSSSSISSSSSSSFDNNTNNSNTIRNHNENNIINVVATTENIPVSVKMDSIVMSENEKNEINNTSSPNLDWRCLSSPGQPSISQATVTCG